MNGRKIFLDTNVVLYLLNGDSTLASFLNNKQFYISIITEMELLSFGNLEKNEEKIIREFISDCVIVPINNKIKGETIKIRKTHNLKLPDSIIAASSKYLNLPLISSDKDFQKINDFFFILYS